MNSAEIGRALTGAWLLAKRDPIGMRAFGDTVEDFWRSFHAALVAAPGYALLIVLQLDERPISDDPMRAMLLEAIGYAVGWLIYPVCAWYLVKGFDREHRFIRYISAYNWAIVIQLVAYIPVSILSNADILPGALMQIVALGATALIVTYQFYVARIALEIDALPALAFVALDLILSLLLQVTHDWLQLRGMS